MRRALHSREQVHGVLGDLHEEYARRRLRSMRLLSDCWYWRQALLVYWRFRRESQNADRTLQMRSVTRLAHGFAHDIRYSVRALRRTGPSSLISMATLGLGIGVSLALFTVLEVIVLNTLPFHQPDRLVMLRGTDQESTVDWLAGPDYYDYRDRANAFESVASIFAHGTSYTVTGGGIPERVEGTTVSVNFLGTLRVQPRFGRGFTADDGHPGARDVVVVSEQLSARRFGSPDGAVGQSLTVNGAPFIIVGTIPEGFHFRADAEIWFPMRPDRDFASDRLYRNWMVFARLADESSRTEAQSQVGMIAAQLGLTYPETNAQRGVLIANLKDTILEDHRPALLILSGAVSLVLLLACANVAGMLLARAPARSQELAIRTALGADRKRLCLQLLIENVLLALGGGLLGYATVFWFQQLIFDLLAMERLSVSEWNASPAFWITATALTLLVGLLSGMYPAVRSARANIAQAIRESGSFGVGSGNAFRSALVVAQVALSILLLVGAGLLIRSFAFSMAQDVGVDERSMITFEVDLPITRYPDAGARARFVSELRNRLASIPGVESVAMTTNLPIRHYGNMLSATLSDDGLEVDRVFVRGVLPDYFDAMGIPILAGRGLRQGDGTDQPSMIDAYLDGTINQIGERSARTAVISESLARVVSTTGDAVGAQFDLNFFRSPLRLEVVGVVGDVRMNSLEDDWLHAVYLPYYQFATPRVGVGLRHALPGAFLAGPLRESVWSMDNDLPVVGVSTMERDIAGSVDDRRLLAISVSVYALLPLLLSGVGLYAVIAHYVAQRSHEIGIRKTLGADAGSVSRLILLKGARLVFSGLAIGFIGAIWLTHFIRGVLFGVAPTDPTTYGAVILFVLVVAIAACAVPTWKAARSDPSVVLRAV